MNDAYLQYHNSSIESFLDIFKRRCPDKFELNSRKIVIADEIRNKLQNVPFFIDNETTYSYLMRLADANGFLNIDQLFDLILNYEGQPVWRKYYWNGYDCNRPELGKAVNFDNDEIWILRSSLLSPLSPFYSKGWLARKVRTFSYNATGTKNILKDIQQLYPKPRICPECIEEYSKYGLFMMLKEHQFPGVGCCYKHGCNLLEYEGAHGHEWDMSSYREMENSESGKQYASFAAAIVNNRVESDLQTLISVVKAKLLDRYDVDSVDNALMMLQDDQELPDSIKFDSLIKVYLKQENLNSCSIPHFLPLIILLYDGDAKSLLKDLGDNIQKEEKDFAESIKGKYSLLSPYSSLMVRLRDKKGSTFLANPHSVMTGWDNPNKIQSSSDRKIFRRLFDFNFGKEWILESDFSMWHGKVSIRNKATGQSVRAKAYDLIDFHDTGVRNRDKYLNDLKEDVESDGQFLLENVRGEGPSLMFSLKCSKCSKCFDVAAKDFFASRYCRMCETNFTVTDEYAESQINELSRGLFHWTGSIADRKFTSSSFLDSIEANTYEGLKAKIRRRIRTNIGNNKISDICKAIEAVVSDHPNHVFFNDDFSYLGFKQDVRAALCRLSRRQVISRLGSAAFSNYGEVHFVPEIADAKYGIRNGIINGVPIGDSLMRYLGLPADRENYSYLLSQGTRTTTHMDRRNICGKPIILLFSAVELTHTNWPIHAFLTTLQYKNLMTNWSINQKALLFKWINEQGMQSKDFIALASVYKDSTVKEAILFVKGVWK